MNTLLNEMPRQQDICMKIEVKNLKDKEGMENLGSVINETNQ